MIPFTKISHVFTTRDITKILWNSVVQDFTIGIFIRFINAISMKENSFRVSMCSTEWNGYILLAQKGLVQWTLFSSILFWILSPRKIFRYLSIK